MSALSVQTEVICFQAAGKLLVPRAASGGGGGGGTAIRQVYTMAVSSSTSLGCRGP